MVDNLAQMVVTVVVEVVSFVDILANRTNLETTWLSTSKSLSHTDVISSLVAFNLNSLGWPDSQPGHRVGDSH